MRPCVPIRHYTVYALRASNIYLGASCVLLTTIAHKPHLS